MLFQKLDGYPSVLTGVMKLSILGRIKRAFRLSSFLCLIIGSLVSWLCSFVPSFLRSFLRSFVPSFIHSFRLLFGQQASPHMGGFQSKPEAPATMSRSEDNSFREA